MKKVLSGVLASVLALSLLASCGDSKDKKGSQGDAGKTPEKQEQGDADTLEVEEGAELVYWPMWAETEPQGRVISEAIEAFSDKYDVDVEVNWAGGCDTRKTLQPALDAGETIDLFDEDVERVNVTDGRSSRFRSWRSIQIPYMHPISAAAPGT